MSGDSILDNAKKLGFIVEEGKSIGLTQKGLEYAERTWSSFDTCTRVCIGAYVMIKLREETDNANAIIHHKN